MKMKVIGLLCICGFLIAGGLTFEPAATKAGITIKPTATPKSRKTRTRTTTSAVQPTPPKRFKAELPEELENETNIRTRRNGNQVNAVSSDGAVPQPTPNGAVNRPRSNTTMQPVDTNTNVGFIGSPADGQGIRRRQGNSNQQVNNTNGHPPITTTVNGNQPGYIGAPTDGQGIKRKKSKPKRVPQ